ncbi:MAG: UvrD-helicase domain-containing protein [Clostridia bacterium]|nr:UvrD-helicase domain-containing protein [Clostridia bacterium]
MNLERFNDRQKEAILCTDGPILILAGAGSGKTTVVVNKIAYILEQGLARPFEILAITFTNKAANEMKERIENLIGESADGMWIHTFHACCMKILRKNIHLLGYNSDFVIYDTSDQKTLMKRCLKELDMDEKFFPIKGVLAEISTAKDDLMEPDSFIDVYTSDFRMSKIGEAYRLYQKRLKESNALDFDDIIMLTVKLLSTNPEVLSYYQNKFKYIFVDEYQDTNNSQYMLTSMLASVRENICVVGDDDQSIYKFRGANINNILDFEKEFQAAKVIKLEQNYRSTQNILNAANFVIANNKGRKGKTLWTDNGDGDKITVFEAENEYEEAEYIAKEIQKEVENKGAKYSANAILYRTNAQSRIIETTLSGFRIPYRVLAGLRFYDRKEVKDVLAYLRLIFNPDDNISLIRVVNEPSRKIGTTSVEKIAKAAAERGISMFAAMENCEGDSELSKLSDKLLPFTKMIRNLGAFAENALPSAVLEKMLDESGYRAMLEVEHSVENQTKLENIGEFIASAFEYEKETEAPNLSEFLERTALVSDIDNYDADADTVVLMTLHSAKGLEFPHVFLCGMEDGLFPSSRSMFSDEELEEERRLCYVGITRAKKNLTVSYALRRNVYGASQYSKPSRFLDEIPPKYTDVLRRQVKVGQTIGESKPQNQALFNDIFNKKVFDVRSKPMNVDYMPGDIVTHKKFGRGMILSVTPEGNDVRIEIAFDDVGTKNLMGAFAKLQKA